VVPVSLTISATLHVFDLSVGMEVWKSIWRVLASLDVTSNDCGKVWSALKMN